MTEGLIRQIWSKIKKVGKALMLFLLRRGRDALVALIAYAFPKEVRRLIAKWCLRKSPNLACFANQLSSLPKDQLKRVILFVSAETHSRESRLANVAKHAGWLPILAYCGRREYPETDSFFLNFRFENLKELLLATWLYDGSLIHIFALNGDSAYPLVRLKNRKIVLDIHDTCSGISLSSIGAISNEKKVVKMADGVIHRDRRLELFYGKNFLKMGKPSAFIPDPLPEKKKEIPSLRKETEIRVVSCGWVDEKENSILRVARILCDAKIHVHVYFNTFQLSRLNKVPSYFELQTNSNYFHIEKPLFGEEYRRSVAGYDFGLAIFEPDLFCEPFKAYHRDYLRGCGSSRLADYITAGLGIIVSPLLEFQHELAHQFAPVCVEATKDFLAAPAKILKEAMSRRREIPSQKMEELTAHGMADRLHTLYSKLSSQASSSCCQTKVKQI